MFFNRIKKETNCTGNEVSAVSETNCVTICCVECGSFLTTVFGWLLSQSPTFFSSGKHNEQNPETTKLGTHGLHQQGNAYMK